MRGKNKAGIKQVIHAIVRWTWPLLCIFTLHNVLSDHSHSATVIGDLHTCKMRTNLSTFQWKKLTVTFCQDLSYRAKLDTKWLVILKGIVW